MEVGFLEVFPPRAAGSRPPVLLQTLEKQLLEATNTAARLASAGTHQQRDPKLAANLSLDVHRQVFETFINGFGEAYKPLLTEIRQAFDAYIQQGLQDALENSSLRQQLLEASAQQAQAEAAVTAGIIQGRQQQRQELYDALAAAQSLLDAAQRRRDLAMRDLARAKGELERLQAAAKASKSTKQRLTDAATAEANWFATRAQAAALVGMPAGPLTQQEDEELEAEMGVVLKANTPQHPLEKALQLLEKHDAAAAAKLLESHICSGTDTQARKQPSRASSATACQKLVEHDLQV